MKKTLRLGTRKSPLALAQSRTVARALEKAHPGLEVELVPHVTKGDRYMGDLTPLGGKGVFTAELEEGLRDGSLDLAVHSLKDVPVTLPDGLTVAAYPERADPADALISEKGGSLEELPAGSLLLTGSLRRQAQVLALAKGLEVEGLRGNVGTRIRKWRSRGAAGLILAAAGLDRLEMNEEELPIHRLDPVSFLPAPGQGTLALEVKAGSEAEELCRVLDHERTALGARAERRLIALFGGDCTLPLAAWARLEDGEVLLKGRLLTPDGRQEARGEARGRSPEEVAEACADEMRGDGAEEILKEIG